jgi:menaquinone-dependent protoporphyrinogen IX oxidase
VKALVVYYSRTETTAELARAIAEALDAELEPLVDTVSRSGARGMLRSLRDAARRRASTIEPLHVDPGAFDLVVVGTPDWGGAAAAPVRAFLEQNRTRLARVAFFLTDGTADHEKVFRDMAALAGRDPVASLGLPHDEVQEGRYVERVAAFAASLR